MYGTYARLNLSIWASNCEVIRAATRKMLKARARKRDFRTDRHKFLRAMLSYHRQAQELAREWRL